jgi:hypothetical protein
MRAKFIYEKFTDNNTDPIEDMGIGKEGAMKHLLYNMTIMDFIDYLDSKPELYKEYRDWRASYDDCSYRIPIEVLEKQGIKKYMLLKIEENTNDYDGWMDYSNTETEFDAILNIGGGN